MSLSSFQHQAETDQSHAEHLPAPQHTQGGSAVIASNCGACRSTTQQETIHAARFELSTAGKLPSLVSAKRLHMLCA